MKLKYYLRGLGIGIVVTTLILTISFKLSSGLSDSEIIDRAQKLGMVMQDATKDTLFAEETSGNNDILQTSENSTDNETTESETTEVETTQNQTTEAETTAAPVEETTPAPLYADITINPGSSSSSVARSLADAGIISNSNDFDQYLEDNDFSEKIEVGTFNVNSAMTYYEIAKTITTR